MINVTDGTFTDVECPLIPTWSGVVLDLDARVYTAVVNYSCDSNYTFIDGMEYKISTCNEYGWWDPPTEDCTGNAKVGVKDLSLSLT